MLTPFRELLEERRSAQAAAGAFTCYDATTALGVVRAAAERRASVVLLVSDQSFRAREGRLHVASLLGKISLPYQAPYVAAKHAVVGLSAALRLELRAERETTVSVCTVLPAGLDTPSSTTPPTTLEGHSGRHRRCTTRIG